MADPSTLEVYRESQWRLCERDPIHFLQEYHQIPIIGKGYEPFKMRSYQQGWVRRVMEDENGRYVVLKARQIGATTTFSGFALWSCLFRPERPWIIVSQGEVEAADTLSTKIRQPFSRLPRWMRDRGPQVIRDTAEELAFDNGSRISAIPSTSRSGRGRTVYGVLMDEVAFMETPEELFAALDPMCYGPLVVFSTANGMGNFFHEVWLDSERDDAAWKGVFQPWHVVEGRDEAWYRQMALRFRGREYLLAQEYPSTPEEAFSKSGRSPFDMDSLRSNQHWCQPDFRYDVSLLDYESIDWEHMLDAAEVAAGDDPDLQLKVWQLPYLERDEHNRLLRQPNFVVGVDVAEGLEHGDYSAVSVYDVNGDEQVASFRGRIPVEDLGSLVEFLGYWFYTALVAVERNNMGLVPLTYLQDHSYPRLLRMDTIAQIRRGDRTPRYGWHTNKATKPKMIVDFVKGLRDESIILHDATFLHEASTFLMDGRGGYGASAGNYDDFLMATLVSYQGALDVGRYPIVWRDAERGPLTFGEVLDIGVPKKESYGLALAGGIGQKGRKEHVTRSFEILQIGEKSR